MNRVLVLTLLVSRVAAADDDVPEVPATNAAEPPVAPAAPPVPPAPTPPAPAIEPLEVGGPPPAFAPWSAAKLSLELKMFSAARWTRLPGDDLTELRLDRGEAGARLAIGARAAAELRVEAIRSTGEGGTLGIDGDSAVLRVKHAQAMGTLDAGPVRIDGALGFVPDPWIDTLQDGYTLLPLARTASERSLGWATADLAASVRAVLGPVRLSITAGNGEGLRYPERNTGKTTTAVLEVVGVNRDGLRVVLAGVARDGSIGAASVRDKRGGGGATVVSARVRGGFEAVRAWGLGDRGEVVGTALAAWAEGAVVKSVALAARGDTLGLRGGGRASHIGGAVSVTPWPSPKGALRIWLAVERQTTSGNAMPIAGAATGDATTVMLIASAEALFAP